MKKLFVLICALFVVANVSAQTRKVGDVVVVNGVKGVVFELSADGRHGKVMSVSDTICSWDNAKEWCANLGGGWRLPTKDELLVIYKNKYAISYTFSVKGYTTLVDIGIYWSSNEYKSYFAWCVNMNDGYIKYDGKNIKLCVCAVSAF